MLHWIWVIIVGALIGAIAGWITRRGDSMNWFFNIIAGLLGSYLGEALLGSWGWEVAGMAIFPSVIGATVLVLVSVMVLNLLRKDF
ncbi:GlsB/YeaQ/YmgE family stress response membrane protein [Ligilactobacillus aviarius]|uniref:GlsB/YeaQ/YmgE family stress response membrane protein n=1 Tax=Ligilactobacillus TaxID=2767887 RepID=UPI0025A33009|nr:MULTISPECIES: GlsB/YeaQ/YmgE family stress response membrane protein [Ligilactobacillus]MDM8277836.1 GlsB/YeaQ/YmgE family stress response membrane protein [Ligilactobacillus aviarius]MDO3393899.1 GlsB/YeaQ/YmgE family stress response membrane protein [Ligilactobacillus sp. 110_WCHN]HLQ87180.1 GlsB/YeaQ/YmgE family stress response membrane protein [Enterococcus sp.]